jgi:predicted alpha/beta-hydrolase family hydrolase
MTPLAIDTPQGPARAHLHAARKPAAALILGHGAGGGVDTPDLISVSNVAVEAGFSVALVEQPYLVAGRRSSPSPQRLDEAWTATVAQLREGKLAGLPIVVGGRCAPAAAAASCRSPATTA